MNNSIIIIVVVVALAFFLIYTQNSKPKLQNIPQMSHFSSGITAPNGITTLSTAPIDTQSLQCPSCENKKLTQHNPSIINITGDTDPYSDLIKKQDHHDMNDPLTYPTMRLPREILNKYEEYYKRTGEYPPFNQFTKPMFDNPIINGFLSKIVEENEPFTDETPSVLPLFRVKNVKNSNRFFYYVIYKNNDSIAIKITLDNIKINSRKYNNADYYGLPELYDGDIIDNIIISPHTKYRVNLYKQHHFP